MAGTVVDMGEKSRRDNEVYGSLWIDSDKGSPPAWMLIAPMIVAVVFAVGCFGLQFLGWDGTPQVGP